jgi:hypothetical protein
LTRHVGKTLFLALAVFTAGGCTCAEKEVETTEVEKVAPIVKPKSVEAPKTFDRDGVLARAEVEVFESPLPVESYTVTAGKQWAGYKNRHTFSDIVRFYKKNLGARYKTSMMRGGAKLTPRSGEGPEIYIARPDRGGLPTSVYYFGQEGRQEPPPFLKAVEAGVKGNQPPLKVPEETPADDTTGAGRQVGGNYSESVETRSDGSKVIVLRPRGDAPSVGGSSPQSKEAPKARKPFSGTRMIEIPEGTLY